MNPKALDLSAAEGAFGVKLIANGKGTQALHDVVVAYQANRRAGTHSTLTKAGVNRSGKKPWNQKGTGNARAGYASSPVWRGGGVVFGPHPRDYSKKTSKTVRRVALKKAISEAAKSGRLHSIASLSVESGKTKDLVSTVKSWNFPESVLILTPAIDRKLLQASRNLPQVEIVEASEVNAEQLLSYKQVLILEGALPALTKRLQ